MEASKSRREENLSKQGTLVALTPDEAEQVFTSLNRQADERGEGFSYTSYSFPSVNIEDDQATLEIVRSFSYQDIGEEQDRVTQETVLEDVGWRILMRDEQYEFYLGGEETAQ